MAIYVLKNCKHYVGSYDLSSLGNRLKVTADINMLDKTVWGALAKQRIAGTVDAVVEGEGFLEDDSATTIGKYIHDQVGGVSVPVTVCPTTGADGEPAFFMNATIPKFDKPYKMGELVKFTVECRNDGAFVRGLVLAEGAKGTTAGGTARQLGAVSADQVVYAAIHCTAASGSSPTCTIKVQSDEASGFSTPADVITFAQLTGIGNEYKTAAGPHTDTYWRLYWTIGGGTPSFTIHGAVGIL